MAELKDLGFAGLIAVLVVKEAFNLIKSIIPQISRNGHNPTKYLTSDEHEIRCSDRLGAIKDIKKKLDETHDAVIGMRSNMRKRNGDQ